MGAGSASDIALKGMPRGVCTPLRCHVSDDPVLASNLKGC